MTTTSNYQTKNEQSRELRWLQFVNWPILARSAVVAVVLGSVLTFINQRGWIAGNDSLQLLPFILVYLIPFAVMLVAQVAGVRQAHLEATDPDEIPSPIRVIDTMTSHGIPARAVLIGLVFGSLNAALSVAVEFLYSGDLAALEVAPLGQAYVLPLVFGLLSQTISYRRARYYGVRI